ncbi:MAG: class I SAM-dependent methyltransferase [Phycisphaerales bacterium]
MTSTSAIHGDAMKDDVSLEEAVSHSPARIGPTACARQTAFIPTHLAALDQWLGLGNIDRILHQLAAHDDLIKSIETSVRDVDFFRKKHWDNPLQLGLYRATLYAVTRSIGAQSIIETGVLHGLSSVFILQGLQDNASNGRLISIDYPSPYEQGPSNADGFDDTLPPGCPAGWIVGDSYRRGWDLRLGRSRDLLDEAVDDLGELDLFVHDSEHTFQTMMFEFETIWPALRRGGILIADNISVNTAFFDFCRAVQRIPLVMPCDPNDIKPANTGIRFGLLQK